MRRGAGERADAVPRAGCVGPGVRPRRYRHVPHGPLDRGRCSRPGAADRRRDRIVDPTALDTILTLLILDVFGNQIRDVSGPADAPLLQQLQLGANPVADLTPLLGCGRLVNLGLDETDATRLTGVDELRAAGVHVNGLA